MTDPWLSAQQRHDATWVELDDALAAVVEVALAETLAKLWRLVLGERVPLQEAMTAAAQPPALDGAEQAARETWQQALTRWVRPIAYAFYQRQYVEAAPDRPRNAPERAREAWWADTLARLTATADGLVLAVRDEVHDHPTESIDALRDRVARVLGLDAPSRGLRDQIADVETRLTRLSGVPDGDRDDLYARRVRLQAELFRIQASRARSKAYGVLAKVLPGDADQFRELARSSARSKGDLERVRRELATVDSRLYAGAARLPADQSAAAVELQRRRQHLYGQLDEADETWRNTARRIARTESTNVMNEATLQRGVDAEPDVGERLVKVWISARDERVRPTHARGTGAHGQVVGIREKFQVGAGFLDRPGDPEGPLEEVINCRCSIVILTEDEHTEIAAVLAAATPEETVTSPAPEPDTDLDSLQPVPWHGVIVVEGTFTGDRRKFSDGSLRTQPLPMPIRFQREDWGGHSGAVVVANLENARRFQGAIRAWGTFADGSLTPEVDEVQGLMATRMARGISVDGDDILDSEFTLEVDEAGNVFEVYQSARLRAATIVAIPAYDEAEIFLGPPPVEWLLEGEPLAVEQNEPETTELNLEDLDALVADVSRVPEQLAEYWTEGEGAAKIGWGRSGDFDRCRRQLAQYVSPGQVSGTCANLHYRALGFWPGQEASGGAPLLASVAGVSFSAEDFEPWPGHEDGPTPLTITDDGHVRVTIAPWDACHTGFSDVCVSPPKSNTQYGYFHTGGVKLADGSILAVGKLTVSNGHANTRLGVRAATAHYDDSTTAVAIVRAFENAIGIQAAGVILPGATEEQIAELLRSPMSGDWRPVREGMEMIAAHGVNSPGFAVMRPMVATAGGHQTAFISAAMPIPDRAEAIAATIGMDTASRLDAIVASVPPLSPAEIESRAAALEAQFTTPNTNEEA